MDEGRKRVLATVAELSVATVCSPDQSYPVAKNLWSNKGHVVTVSSFRISVSRPLRCDVFGTASRGLLPKGVSLKSFLDEWRIPTNVYWIEAPL